MNYLPTRKRSTVRKTRTPRPWKRMVHKTMPIEPWMKPTDTRIVHQLQGIYWLLVLNLLVTLAVLIY